MEKFSDFVFFFDIVNYEQSKPWSICSETTNIFNNLLLPTNEYEKNTTKSNFLL